MRSLLLALSCLLVPLAAEAQDVSAADARAIRQVIEAQLDAFKRDDGERAFSLATAGIRASFGTPEAFMAMVRMEYYPVYRPKRVVFEEPVLYDGEVAQPVRFTDMEGALWLGLYPMRREGGEWRTNGCHLERLPGRDI